MTKIDIYSGFLGAGKTTLIKKMIQQSYAGQKLVLIENEFGQIGIDGDFLQEAGIHITEMNSGCICCSLVGDFGEALQQVITQYTPDRILIEPSGVGKLSDVLAAVNKVTSEEVTLGYTVTVADAGKVKSYAKNFGEFYINQVENASAIVLSRTASMPEQKLSDAVAILRQHNPHAAIVTTDWDQLSGEQLVEAMEGKTALANDLAQLQREHLHHHHHHEEECCCGHDHHEHHHHHEDECCCGHDHHEHHHHHHEEECCCGHDHHEHHHHHHEEECCCGHDHHEHHHHHEEECCCGHDHHEHHHHHDEHCNCGHDHHADEVFQAWGVETARKFTKEDLEKALTVLDSQSLGVILRAKGIVESPEGVWLHFDYVPGEHSIRTGSSAVTGKLCVIGAELKEADVAKLFGV